MGDNNQELNSTYLKLALVVCSGLLSINPTCIILIIFIELDIFLNHDQDHDLPH